MCGAQAHILEPVVEDVYFRYPGRWRYDRCGNARCGTVWIANPLPESELAAAYACYYTHDAAPPGRIDVLLGRWIIRRARRHADGFPRIPLLFREAENHLILSGAVVPDAAGLALDIGCGSGERLAYLEEIGWGQAVGFDPDVAAVERGRTAGRNIAIGTAETVPMADRCAAMIILHHVVEHLADVRTALLEAARLLRQGGHILVVTPNPAAESRQRWGRWWRAYEAPRHLRLYTLESLQQALLDCGFAIEVARTSGRAGPAWSREAERATNTPKVPGWKRWWMEDCAIRAADARIRSGDQMGEELFVVAQRL